MKQLFTFFLLFYSLTNFAQNNNSFKHLNVEHGLSQSSVLSITQDARGFLWFGTRFGLNKYDSRNFKIYKHDPNDPGSLINSETLSTILLAKDGTIWIGSPSGLNKYNEDQDNFDHMVHDSKKPEGLTESRINCIFQDRENRIWVGTANGLNLLTDKKKYHFQHFLYHKKLPQQIYALAQDHNGDIWIGTSNGLMIMKIKNGRATFQFLKAFSDQINQVNDNHVTSIVEDRENNIWIGTKQTGLSRLNLQTKDFVTFKYSSSNTNGISSNNIRKIILDQEGKLWIGTLHGISIYNPQTKTFSTLQNEPENKKSLSQNSVYDIFQDKQGIIWVGTYYGGINMIYPNYTPFNVYRSSKNGLSSNVISSITEDTNHNLWIGTEGEGLNYFDRKKNTYTHFKYNPNNPKSLSSNLVKSIFRDKKNRIWVGTHLGGLNLYVPQSNSFIRFTNKPNDPSTISSDAEISSIFEDSYGRFWIGTSNGLNSLDPNTGKFVRKKINGLSDAVFYIFEDSRRRLFVATNSALYILDHNSDRFKFLPYETISCITEDKKGVIWLGTLRNGIYKLDASNRKIGVLSQKDGLPSDNIVGILEDDNRNFWISTDNGLCKYNPDQKSFKTYNIKDGLPGNEFNYKSLLKDSNGEFFFGGLSGFISFIPAEIKENKVAPNAIFTQLKLFNKPVKLNADDGLLKTNISKLNTITFKSDQNVFSIDFTVLNFIKSDKNAYAYKLIGFEKNWNYVSTPTASYTNLSPGNYKLLVKGSNNDGLWTENSTELTIKVLPPFYQTWWAYLLYFCILTGILILGVRYLLIRAVLKKEKEINEHKLEFFTNISHEIRTPLTLIVGPLENIIEHTQDNPQLNKQLQPIKNNADRLMHLVTELLDFRKAESGKMTLQVSPGDVVKFCKEIFLAFQNMAISNNIDYTFETEAEEIKIYFDKVQLEKVFFNILSNAFKFTPKGGKINLKIGLEKDLVHINICDNGKGIPVENQANLFNNFYQANPGDNIGTGLGLSFSKSITELHKGNISFESSPQQNNQPGFTCFSINLKTGKDHFQPSDFIQDYIYYDDAANYTVKVAGNEKAELLPDAALTRTAEKKDYSILLVEDNAEVRNFIKNSLQNHYTIFESEDGQKGWENAIETIPDLIISDVMMPNMDGLELCRKLKTDERTSHIPIVLLTARSAYVHQINGFENGADAYIMKPFNLRILELNISNLLNARETIKKKFAQVVKLEPKNLIINTTEQNFLNKIIAIIEDRITDPDFDVPTLSTEIGMSQPVLYKKIRALTDLSVNDFIKSIRLKKAAQLLKLNQGNISEIAYSVGFNDRKYFSLEFKKYFGKTPSEFTQEQHV
ncbi:hybrid sensor histidine kinase/response regulator transcription factor [Pedobacter punctiformis]|uniref:histidine kinase n=1 Tax=Pedobacter punctiformis TaxID=3004097 RepID=A0ABT4LC75_9SPHI|nr:hybrid sensor histidine kinase/response regulator transcription factor [Pedobacter sp. HCMS5-2]MCZ4245527.1 response regulator [Pedobacter sp. HCMS5-2]